MPHRCINDLPHAPCVAPAEPLPVYVNDRREFRLCADCKREFGPTQECEDCGRTFCRETYGDWCPACYPEQDETRGREYDPVEEFERQERRARHPHG